jgi:hypothetical protein
VVQGRNINNAVVNSDNQKISAIFDDKKLYDLFARQK